MNVTVVTDRHQARKRLAWSKLLNDMPEGAQLMVEDRYYEKQDADWNDWLLLDSGRSYENSIITDSEFVHLCAEAVSVIEPLERHP